MKKIKKQILNKKKVAIFSGFYLPFLGGIERYTSKLSNELVKLDYDVIIVTTNHANLLPIEVENITIYRLPTYKLFKNRYPIIKRNHESRCLFDQIKNENVEYVICNTRFQLTTPLGLKLAKENNIQPIIIEHGSSHFSVGIKVLDMLGKIYEHYLTSRVSQYSVKYYGVSKRCNKWLEHFNIKASGVFYNSVDKDTYDIFKSSNYKKNFDNKVVITYAGRIIREKGVEMLLDAFMILQKKYNSIVLVIAGDGPLLPMLKNRYKNSRIFFEGKLSYSDTMSLFNKTDIFCYPSMYPEGLPTSILEAGIMKSAVIATDRGGTKEVITGDDYGIIIEENIESLTDALEDLINNPLKVSQLKDNLHKRIIDNFTWKITASKVDRVLKEMW